MNVSCPYQLAQNVAIRRERFGGLVYNYDNRRLFFLHSHAVVDFVMDLDGVRPVNEAIAAFIASRGRAEPDREALLDILRRLQDVGVVRPVAASE